MKKEERTIKYIFESDPEKAQDLIKALATGTLRSLVTIYHWLMMRRRPCFLEMKFIQKQIAEIYGEEIPLTELFPVKK